MKEPKVGEYWYVKHLLESRYSGGLTDTQEQITLCKVMVVNKNRVLVRGKYNMFEVDIETLLGKWEPGWFFRMFGFK